MATPEAYPLIGQTAAVTGASGGIGRAIALALARAGADCIVHAGNNQSAAAECAEEIRRLGRRASVVIADFTLSDELDAFVETAWNWRQGLDVWVNNAGADVLTGEAADWPFEHKMARLWMVDVQGAVVLSRNVGARMKRRGGGVILNMGWDQSECGMAGDSGEMFAATKGAVAAFTRSLAKSLAPEVRVNCLAPGWIRTSWGEQTSAYWQDRACKESLMRRWGTPEDVASAACFLASPAASFITGQIVPVNGGRA